MTPTPRLMRAIKWREWTRGAMARDVKSPDYWPTLARLNSLADKAVARLSSSEMSAYSAWAMAPDKWTVIEPRTP